MKKNTITTILISAGLIASGLGLTQVNKTKTPTNVSNVRLLTNANSSNNTNNNGTYGCVINGNDNLTLTNKNGQVKSYVSVGEMLKLGQSANGKTLVTVEETGETGYINNSNIQAITSGTNDNLVRMNRKGFIINVSSQVHIRANATMNSAIIGNLNNNSTLTITGKQGNWFRVNVNGVKGYIFDEYVAQGAISTSVSNTINSTPTTITSNPITSTPVSKSTTVVANSPKKANNINIPATTNTNTNTNTNTSNNITKSSNNSVNHKVYSHSTTNSTINNSNNNSTTTTSHISNGTSNTPAVKPSTTSTSSTGNTPAVKHSTNGTSSTSNTPAVKHSTNATNSNSNTPAVKHSTNGTSSTDNTPATKHSTNGTNSNGNTPAVKHSTNGTNSNGNTPAVKHSTNGTNSNGNTPAVKHSTNGTNSTSNTPAVKPSTNGTSSTGNTPAVKHSTNGTSSTSNTPAVKPSNKGINSNSNTPAVKHSTNGTNSNGNTPAVKHSTNGTSSNSNTPAVKHSTNGTSSASNTPAVKPSNKGTNSNSNTPAVKHSTNGTSSTSNTPTVKPSANGTNSNGNTPTVKPSANGTSSTSNTPAVKPSTTNNNNGNSPTVNGNNNNNNNNNSTGKNTYNNVPYNSTLTNYVSGELKEYLASLGQSNLSKAQLTSLTNQLTNAINPKAASTPFEFLKVNQYRAVNESAVANLLAGKGVFNGEANAFINAAKEYNLDPVYLIAQSALETGWGTSNFANGITINEIANTKAPIYNKAGQLTGYQMIKLPQPVTVYNLFGIGAYNSSANFPNKATILATTYAYNNGWTSVSAAINGAAAFLSNNYINNPNIAQNTPYELRYINAPSYDMWHQYSSDINYASQIAEIMNENKDLYSSSDNFSFAIPQFQSSNQTNSNQN